MITVILSFNHPNITKKCVDSALQFVKPADLLLIHNGSQKHHIDELKRTYTQIRHATLEVNRGFSGGANFGLNYAFEQLNADWVYFVTNDCELKTAPQKPLTPGLYAPLIYRRETQKIDSIGGVFYTFTGRLKHIHDVHEARKRVGAITEAHGRAGPRRQPHLSYFYVPGTAFYIDRETFQKLGGFDETLHTYWEDVDLSARAHQLQLKVSIAPETQLTHKVGKTCHKIPFYTNTLFHRNRSIVSRRHTHTWLRPFQLWRFQKRYKNLVSTPIRQSES